LLPQLDIIDDEWQYVFEIAYYRQDRNNYETMFKKEKPVQPNHISNFIYRTAQWNKSVAGKNLERAIDLALAETEAKPADDEDIAGGIDAWKE
jgi:hypothetical protein